MLATIGKQLWDFSLSSNPTLSVIIPVYNGEAFVADAIGSCLTQIKQTEAEVVVINDGSTDRTPEVLDRFSGDRRVQVLSQENSGPSAARNFGIEHSQGELISFLDADDLYCRNTIDAFINFAKSAPATTALFYSSFYRFSDPEFLVPVAVNLPMRRPFLFQQYLLPRALPVLTSTVMARRSAIEEAGMFDREFLRCEDLNLWTQVIERHDVARLPIYSTLRRQHNAQITKDRAKTLYWRERANISFLKRNPFSAFAGRVKKIEMAAIAADFATRFLRSAEPLPFCANHCLKIARKFDPNLATDALLQEAKNMMEKWPYTVEAGR